MKCNLYTLIENAPYKNISLPDEEPHQSPSNYSLCLLLFHEAKKTCNIREMHHYKTVMTVFEMPGCQHSNSHTQNNNNNKNTKALTCFCQKPSRYCPWMDPQLKWQTAELVLGTSAGILPDC